MVDDEICKMSVLIHSMVSSGMENRQIYLIYFFPNAEDIIQAIISVLLSDRNSLSDTKNIFLVCYKEI